MQQRKVCLPRARPLQPGRQLQASQRRLRTVRVTVDDVTAVITNLIPAIGPVGLLVVLIRGTEARVADQREYTRLIFSEQKEYARLMSADQREYTRQVITQLEESTQEGFRKLEERTKEDFSKLEESTKEDFSKLEESTKEGFRSTKEDFRKLEERTKEDFRKLEESTKEGFRSTKEDFRKLEERTKEGFSKIEESLKAQEQRQKAHEGSMKEQGMQMTLLVEKTNAQGKKLEDTEKSVVTVRTDSKLLQKDITYLSSELSRLSGKNLPKSGDHVARSDKEKAPSADDLHADEAETIIYKRSEEGDEEIESTPQQ